MNIRSFDSKLVKCEKVDSFPSMWVSLIDYGPRVTSFAQEFFSRLSLLLVAGTPYPPPYSLKRDFFSQMKDSSHHKYTFYGLFEVVENVKFMFNVPVIKPKRAASFRYTCAFFPP